MHEFRELAENVYAFIQPALIWYSTAGVIVGNKDVIVIDSLTNEKMTRDLLGEIGRVTEKPVKFLINTHSHADHVYTNHMFDSATSVCSKKGREKTLEFMSKQSLHDETFARLFHDVDFSGGRYKPQDMTFSGGLTIHQGDREIHMIELGPGHSESDVIIHLPEEGIVFCGDLFMNGLPPLPAEGCATAAIASIRKIEELDAQIYVPGHGKPGTRKDVEEQRLLLERLISQSRGCFEKGLNFDEAVENVSVGSMPSEFVMPVLISCYCEWAGKMPQSTHPGATNHMQVLSDLARRADILMKHSRTRL